MVVECPSCNTKFSVDSSLVSQAADVRFHCSRCNHYFTLADVTEKESLEQDTLNTTSIEESVEAPSSDTLEEELLAHASRAAQLSMIPESADAQSETKISSSSFASSAHSHGSSSPAPASAPSFGALLPGEEEESDLPLVTADWPDQPEDRAYEVNLGDIFQPQPPRFGKKTATTTESQSSPKEESSEVFWHDSQTTVAVQNTGLLDTPLDDETIDSEERTPLPFSDIVAAARPAWNDSASEQSRAAVTKESQPIAEKISPKAPLETTSSDSVARRSIPAAKPSEHEISLAAKESSISKEEHTSIFSFPNVQESAKSSTTLSRENSSATSSGKALGSSSKVTGQKKYVSGRPIPKITFPALRLPSIPKFNLPKFDPSAVSSAVVASVPLLVFVFIAVWSQHFDATPAWAQRMLWSDSDMPKLPPAGLAIIETKATAISADTVEVTGTLLNGSVESFSTVQIEARTYGPDNQETAVHSEDVALSATSGKKSSVLDGIEREPEKIVLRPGDRIPFRISLTQESKTPSAWFSTRVKTASVQ